TLLLKEENYSANDRLMRTILYPKYTRVLDRYLPIQIIMRDEVNKGEQTQQILSEISTSAIPNKVFTKAYLEGLN
ncbi:MAG TPA: outer membrane lipoprotein-sorting protein, partial [Treponemataceae bacterium]|nr:outer membrane lipoprotein-sorting protein [Treponemataceae bacterium]